MSLINRSLLLLTVISGVLSGSLHQTQAAGPPRVRDPQRIISQPIRSWSAMKFDNVVKQKKDYSCGAAALATLIQYYWNDYITEEDFLEVVVEMLPRDELIDRIENGLSMTDLRKAAVKKNYLAVLGRRKISDMYKLKVPVIVRIVKNDYEHFVVFRGIIRDRVFLADPIRGNIRLSVGEFKKQWLVGTAAKGNEGVILVVAKRGVKSLPKNSPLFVSEDYCKPLRPEVVTARKRLFVRNILNPFVNTPDSIKLTPQSPNRLPQNITGNPPTGQSNVLNLPLNSTMTSPVPQPSPTQLTPSLPVTNQNFNLNLTPGGP